MESDIRAVNGNIYAIRLGVDTEATPLIMGDGRFLGEISLSPDGRWLAYNRGYEVWVRPFPDVSAGQWQISTDGGTEPVWAHSGDRLFYNSGPALGRELVVADIIVDPAFALGQQRALFAVDS